MNDPKNDEKTPSDELREGLTHLFAAARKVAKNVEPHVNKPLEDAERLLGKIGRGGEVIANELGKEVATFATRVADRLRAVADRAEGNTPTERPPTPSEAPPTSEPRDPTKP